VGSDSSPQRDAQKLSGFLSDAEDTAHSVRFYEFDRFRLDPKRRLLTRDGEPVVIQPKALDTLLLLVQHRGRLLEKEELMRLLWPDAIVEEANLTQNVFVARKALGETPGEQRFIATVARQGYRFVGEVQEIVEEIQNRTPAREGSLAASSTQQDRAPARLGVLPFVNLTGDSDREYLADGLSEETIATLGQIDPFGLVVIGRTSMMRYKRTTRSLADIGRELDADYLVESSIRTEHDRLRVITGLVRARDQVQIWSRSYERELTSVLELQKELSAGIAEQIRSWLAPQRSVALPRHQTTDPRAYDCYLRGLFAQRQRTPASNAAAIRLFEETTALDPNFALAWSAQNDIYPASGFNGDGDPRIIAPRARDAATRAVLADPQLAEAQTAIARVRFWFDWDWAAAESAVRRALALDPTCARALLLLSFMCSIIGRDADTLAATRRSIDQDPLNPLYHPLDSEVAFRRRDYDAAAKNAERSLELDSQFWIGHMLAAQAYERLREYDRAIESLTIAQRLSGNNSKTISLRGYILARVGRTHEARAALEHLTAKAVVTYVPAYAVALVQAGLGDREAIFEWLERAYVERDVHLVLLMIDPKWDPYRGDARLQSLLARCAFVGRRAG
jgi:TolB-like protein